MELLYVWIEEYNNIHHQGFNFSPKHHFHFEPNEKEGPVTGGTLTHDDINPSYPDNFFGEHISNITAIVGKNGSGKSSLIKAIGDAISFFEKIILVFTHEGTYYYWKNIPCVFLDIDDITLNEDGLDKKSLYLEHVIYYSPFINSNRNYIFYWLGTSEISSMDRMAKALSSVVYNPNSNTTAAAPNQIYHHFLSAYCAQEMTTQINFIKEIADSKFQIVPDTIAIPQNVELGIPFYGNNLSAQILECPNPNNFILYTIVDALNRDVLQKGKVREDVFSYSTSLEKIEDWLKDICNNRGYDIEEIKSFCSQLNDKTQVLVNYGNKDEGQALNITLPYLSLPLEVLLKQNTGRRSSWANDLAITLTWHDLSDGEATMLSLFARLWEKLQKVKHSNIILLDEFELGLHPQWQKEAISRLIKFFEFININKHHLIITSHSPIVISDLPRENVIFLDKNASGECVAKEPNDIDRTFGANIHSLYRSSFFMDGVMGEFAKGKIDDVIKDLRENGEIIEERKKEIHYIIDMVGEPIIRNQLRKMYNEKFHKYDSLNERIAKLENELAELKNRRNDTN